MKWFYWILFRYNNKVIVKNYCVVALIRNIFIKWVITYFSGKYLDRKSVRRDQCEKMSLLFFSSLPWMTGIGNFILNKHGNSVLYQIWEKRELKRSRMKLGSYSLIREFLSFPYSCPYHNFFISFQSLLCLLFY